MKTQSLEATARRPDQSSPVTGDDSPHAESNVSTSRAEPSGDRLPLSDASPPPTQRRPRQ